MRRDRASSTLESYSLSEDGKLGLECSAQEGRKGRWRMAIEARLQELGIVLPAPPAAGGNYVSAKTLGNIVFLAGVISADSTGIISGTVGLDRTIERVTPPRGLCALTQLAVLQAPSRLAGRREKHRQRERLRECRPGLSEIPHE